MNRDKAQIREQAAKEARAASVQSGPEVARRRLLRTLDSELRQIPSADRGPVACAAGCAFCCHLRVMATPVEVFGLLDFISDRYDSAAFDAFRARVTAAVERVRAVPPERLLATNIACPVLEDGRCGAYQARPFNCRSYHSLDRGACEASYNAPGDRSLGHPQLTKVARVHEAVQGGLVTGLAAAGHDSAQYELVTALAEALSDPGARDRYDRGEAPVFRDTVEVIM